MRLSTRTLNRTLWVRQQLVDPTVNDPLDLVRHLIGLQAQENLPPYLSLAARVHDFDPSIVSAAIEARRLVRVLSMRGTVHLLHPDDALALRPWVQPALDRVSRSNQMSKPASDVSSAALHEAVSELLAAGPLPVAELGSGLSARFPDVAEPALRNAARERVPMVQVPPRGLWQQSGGVVYELLTTWTRRSLAEPDVPELVRRYLRAFGPASPADMTKWALVTRLGTVFTAMGDELVRHQDAAGHTLYDLPDAELADPDLPLPTTVFGTYDNLWLSHADRARVAAPAALKHWVGSNGGTGWAVFVDGMLAGVWRKSGFEAFVTLGRRVRAEVDDAIERARSFAGR